MSIDNPKTVNGSWKWKCDSADCKSKRYDAGASKVRSVGIGHSGIFAASVCGYKSRSNFDHVSAL